MRHCAVALFCMFIMAASCAASIAASSLPTASPLPPDSSGASNPSGPISWNALLPGFEMAELTAINPLATFIVIRVDPQRYEFTLHMASEGQNGSLADIATEHSLLAAVNAGMYLPDQRTSTGYLKSPTHINNARIARKFGSFFVAAPKKKGLPLAALLDRDADDWQKAIADYSLVVQNYRLTNTQGKVLWPLDATSHCIAALGQDHNGAILLIFGKSPMNPASFAATLLALPLDIRSLMYLEGGNPAALLVRAGDVRGQWSGNRLGPLLGGQQTDKPVPNILGVRAR
ncbi:phosphodiester glycosidase family protein [Desulfovibrio sp. OttesenSCG-928-I05]|nr:phosphodiester glycosidase family protein [Desulfovibrio sp. OttesenSCG-928-I05]